MTKIVFQKVTYPIKRTVTCNACGKKFTRSKTFWNTVNPFNKNADGTVKTWIQINDDLREEARVWIPLPDCGKHTEEVGE